MPVREKLEVVPQNTPTPNVVDDRVEGEIGGTARCSSETDAIATSACPIARYDRVDDVKADAEIWMPIP